MWHQKFIESVSKHKMNNEDPHYVEYNNLINSVTEFANSNYNIKAKKVDNVQNCISILKEYREKCLKELNSILKKKSKDNLYIIQSKFKMKNWIDLAKYTVKTDKEILFEGNFEDTKDYLLKEAY